MTAREPAAEEDPQGGLTEAGRAAFRRRDGSSLKPGVTKPESEITPEEQGGGLS